MTNFKAIWDEATKAGLDAGQKCTPTPMVVRDANLLTDKPLPGGQSCHVSGGVCGFAWISFKGNTPWARWAKTNARARKGYPSGMRISVQEFGQSMERKIAYAEAVVQVLRKYGIEAYSDWRMD
jgi:hypothetical protein